MRLLLQIRLLRRLYCLLFLTAGAAAQAQERPVYFQHYTTRDGLGSNVVCNIAQDRQGYIWISTVSGVDRYDGNTFTHFQQDNTDSSSLPFEKATLTTDLAGHIWIYGSGGLYCFDPETNRFIPLLFPVSRPGMSAVSSVCCSAKGVAWIATTDGRLLQIDLIRHRATVSYRFPGELINDLFEDSRGRLWIVSDRYLRLLDEKRGITAYRDESPGASGDYYALFEDRQQRLWLSSHGGGIKEFHPATGLFDTYRFNPDTVQIPANYAFRIIQPKGSRDLWIASADNNIGIAIFNPDTRRFRYLNHENEQPGSPANNASMCIFEDNSGIIWYGTESGLDKYDPYEHRFPEINLNQTPGIPKDAAITCLYKDDSLLWIGTTGEGLFAFGLRSRRIVHALRPASLSGDPESNIVLSCCRRNGRVLAGTNAGLFIYDPVAKRLTERPSFRPLSITALVFRQGKWIIGSDIGCIVADSSLSAITDTIAPGTSFRSLLPHPNGKLYAGTAAPGLYRVELPRQLIHVRAQNNATWRKLDETPVSQVSLARDGRLLLATPKGFGVANMQSGGALRFYTRSDGLASDNCFHVAADSSNTAWLVQSKGISGIDLATGAVKNYGAADGLLSPVFENAGLCSDDSGQLYFGRYISIYVFNGPAILKNSLHAPLYITGLRADDSLVRLGGSHALEPVSLSYRHRNVSFEYVLLNYSNTGGNTYEYRLDPLDDGWNNAGNRRFVTYSNLSPGRYTFRVRARNSDGSGSRNEALQQLVIVPPYWETWWFRLPAGCAALVLLHYVIRRRDRSIKAKAQVKHQMIEAEMKALRAQMNPHFIFNCLNSINRYIVKNDALAASGYLTKFSKLIRLILDTSASETIPLDRELQLLQLYIAMELLRFTNRFSYDIAVKEPLQPQDVLIPSMIIQPFVENAIWHGLLHKEDGHGRLTISFLRLDACTLQVIVEDNGIGRKKAQELKSKDATRHKSYGMRSSNDRLQLINDLHGRSASVEIIDLELGGQPTGTRVILIIPLQKQRSDDQSNTDR